MPVTLARYPLARTKTSGFSSRACRLSIGLALLASLTPEVTAQDPPTLNDLALRHSPSVGRAFTSTQNGKWLFHSEGGTMVFIKANATNTSISEPDYRSQNGYKRVGIGNEEVLVAKMMLDPAADQIPGDLSVNVGNLLYMACGRDGFWIMEADVDQNATNGAWRVDDSGNLDPSTQKSRRWCADVDFCRIDGVDYALALFTKKGASVLRIYDLSKVRNVAYTGLPITADLQVVLNNNSYAPVNSSPESYSRPVALALAVDQEEDVAGKENAMIYVAMGPHGLIRVEVKANPDTGSTEPLVAVKTDGPAFGSGSVYNGNPGLAPNPQDVADGLYGNFVIRSDWVFRAPTQVVERNEAPMFVDVAVFDGLDETGVPVHQLFVAVDHLFWLVFDLKNQTFGPSMPILHHEGDMWSYTSVNGAGPVPVVTPLDPSPGWNGAQEVGFARSLAIVDTTEEGPLLVVTGPDRSILRHFSATAHEAVGFDEHLEPGRSWTRMPATHRTYLYRIKPTYPDPDFNTEGAFDEGGSELYVPPDQDGLGLTSGAYLAVFNSSFIVDPNKVDNPPAIGLARMFLPWSSTGTTQAFKRPVASFRGRMAFNIGSSILDPNLLLTAGNDAGLPQDGFVVMGKDPATGGYDVKVYDQLPPGTDRRGSGRTLSEPDMQWIDPVDPLGESQYMWTSGIWEGATPADDIAGFKLMHITVPGLDAFGNTPVQDWHGYIEPPLNRFGGTGRVYYQAGSMSREFDADQALGNDRLFGTWQSTPEGLVVLDSQKVLTVFGDPNNHFKSFDSNGWSSNEMRVLVTHPEFNNMPDGTQATTEFWTKFQQNPDRPDLAQAWPAKLIELPAENYVLAVPCGQIHADPAWRIYDPAINPGADDWDPDDQSLWQTGFTHGFVQFWEMKEDLVNDPGNYWPATTADNHATGVSPLAKIVVPDANTSIGTIAAVTMTHNESPETYLFCADFGGHLDVYSITDITSNPGVHVAVDNATKLVATWDSKPNLFDDIPSLIFDIAIDYRGSNKAKIYVTSPRVGVQVLEFQVNPNATSAPPTLVYESLIQSSGWTTGVDLRVNADGESPHLLVSEYGGGFSVFKEAP